MTLLKEIDMILGKCVTNFNEDVGYVVSMPFQDKDTTEWFVKVIWIDPLLQAVDANQLYPETLTITDEMESGLSC